MSYFNHAYKKTFLAKTVEAEADTPTSGLDAGEVALIATSNYKSVVSSGDCPDEFIIAQGNLNEGDTLGGNSLHGGYNESIKSKVIKKDYITKLWKVEGTYADASTTVTLHVPDDCYGADAHPQIRIDLKGSEILRSLNRNAYFIADATGCDAYTGDNLVAAWKKAIDADPVISKFVSVATTAHEDQVDTSEAEVAEILATITITVNYEATAFDKGSFDTRDHYNTDPLTLSVTAIDDEGDACGTSCLETAARAFATGSVTEYDPFVLLSAEGLTVVRKAATVTGEHVLRDLIEDGRYRQDGGHNQGNRDSNRFKEIEGGKAIVDAVKVADPYVVYYLQHSVPRFNNPGSVFDNDQYIVAVAVKRYDESDGVGTTATTEIGKMNTLWGQIASLTGLTVTTPLV